MSTRKQPEYTVGQSVHVVVDKVFPFGVFVRLADGTSAYIRRRELSWASSLEPREFVHEGQVVDAVVVNLPQPEHRMELSLRATLPDPWGEFTKLFRVGSVAKGTVRRTKPFGAFVEILPGVDGLVPLAQLATWKVKKPEDVLWEGDQVEAVVTHIISDERVIRLSIRARLLQLAGAAQVLEQINQISDEEEPSFDVVSGSEEVRRHLFTDSAGISLHPEKVGPILVIDDNIEICDSLVRWLRAQGYEVDGAQDVAEAWARVRNKAYSLYVVDIDLAGEDGLTFLKTMTPELGQASVAVMSIPEWLRERAADIEALGASEVFTKPIDLSEIQSFLHKIETGEPLPVWRAAPATENESLPRFETFLAPATSDASLDERLRSALEQLVGTTHADAGLIFFMEPDSRTMSAVAQVGADIDHSLAAYSLDESPVGDVILRGKPIFENQVFVQAHERFRKLLGVLSFESCIGVPIPVHGETRHALFLFARGQDAFHVYRLRDALAMATLLSAIFERDQLSQRARGLNTLLLSGQLALGLGHEIYNKISGIEIQLRNLQSDCARLEQVVAGLADSYDYWEMKQQVAGLLNTSSDLRSTVGLFQQLTRAEEVSAVDVSVVLKWAVALVHPVARKHGVKIRYRSDIRLLPARGSTVVLQQVFLNIMLNAVQHIAAVPNRVGCIEVTATHHVETNREMIRVRLSDNGPGIHRKLWDRVFDLGFTTRSDGSGIGLFIARSLIESLGGAIRVEDSVVPLGTTFLVEIPVATRDGG